MNLTDLANKMDTLSKKVEEDVNKIAKEVAMEVVTYLAYNTPVDTSKAISNWQVGVNTAKTSEIDAHNQGNQGSTLAASALTTINNAESELKSKKYGQEIHITNNASYIKDLENGSSRQAPTGFVSFAIAAGRGKLRNIKI
jgi:HK97 gp10 family phage protein